jgi:hypothetical protein
MCPPEPLADDPLAELRDRIQATQEAAQRLAEEAGRAQRAAGEGRVPPAGWQTPRERGERSEELQSLVAVLESLRGLVPPELQQQLTEVIRQILLLIRAIIDWWVDRLDAGGRQASRPAADEVQDIPVA